MDVHPEKAPGLGLPQPLMEQGPAATGAEVRPISVEAAPPSSDPSAGVVMQPVALPPQVVPAVISQVTDPLAVSSSSASSSADDTDALDEEWVNKAKAIVERTKDDPYTESKELGRAKADYLKVRYNKQIKVADEHS